MGNNDQVTLFKRHKLLRAGNPNAAIAAMGKMKPRDVFIWWNFKAPWWRKRCPEIQSALDFQTRKYIAEQIKHH